LCKPISSIDREQPELIEIAPIEVREHRIGMAQWIAIPRYYLECGAIVPVTLRTQKRR
jgi:hypothetical protein